MLACAKIILCNNRSEMANQTNANTEQPNKALPYEQPTLVTYGNLTELTRFNNGTIGQDNGSNDNGVAHKTR